MNRESIKKTKHKSPRFRDYDDEDLDWKDKLDLNSVRRKIERKLKRRRNSQEDWEKKPSK